MENIFAKIFEVLSSVEGSAVTIALILEFVFRLFPSKDPLSWLYLIANVFRKTGEVLTKSALVLDKVLPQKLK